MKPKAILELPMGDNDADAKTVGEYLKLLLLTVIREQETFSGKRPFGNSDWIYELAIPFVKFNIISGKFDEEDDKFLQNFDQEELYKKIKEILNSVFTK